jgi:zinc protease
MKIVAAALVLLSASAVLGAEERPLPRALPAFGTDKPLPVPPIDAWKTPEGLTVWLVKRAAFPKATMVLASRGGTAADPRGLEGMAELLAETIKDGTATRSSRQIAEELQTVGADVDTGATADAITVTVNGLASGTAKMIQVLADIARNASFPPDEVALARTNALQSLEARMSTPEFLAARAFAKAVYGTHPYHVVAPTPEVIKAVTPAVLKREAARRLRPERSLLVVAGDIDLDATKKAISEAFGGWKPAGKGAAPTPPAPAAPAHKIYLVNRPGSVQSQIVVGRPGPKATDPDNYPALVTNTIFGGAFGSRLTRNIREDKGYTYSPGASVAAREQGGLFRVRADVRNEVTAATLNEISYELGRLGTTKPSDEEVKTAKRYQSGLYLLRNQIQGSVARLLANNWINGLPPEALGEFVPKVSAVTVDSMEKLGRTLFSAGSQVVVVVGDAEKVKPDLLQFGEVVELKP